MADLKTSKYIITKPSKLPPGIDEQRMAEHAREMSAIQSTHLLSVNDEIVKDFFYADCVWFWSGESQYPMEESHFHDFDEVIAFMGSNPEDPYDLGGKVSIWLDDKEEVLTNSSLIFVRAGTKHCPILLSRIDRPIFLITMAPNATYTRTNLRGEADEPGPSTRKLSDYTIITEFKQNFYVHPGDSDAPPPPRSPDNTIKSTRVFYLDEDVVEGAFYTEFLWIYEGSGTVPEPEHSHDWEELIGMVGSDPKHPRDLGGPMSIALDGEIHTITESSFICVPGGVKHCPWKFLGIKKPTLVFTAGPARKYSGTHWK